MSHRKLLTLSLLTFFLFTLIPAGYTQNFQPFSSTLDPVTKQLLKDIRGKIMTGETENIEPLLSQVINSSGYIDPLAEIYYHLARTETQGEQIAQHYGAIIKKWPDSAWAQKAFCELIPLILMSEGKLGSNLVPVIWEMENRLIALATDAKDIGEDAPMLKEEVLLNLLYLANSREDVGRVMALTKNQANHPARFKPQFQLAHAISWLLTDQNNKAADTLQSWIDRFPNSNYLPSAYFTLFRIVEDNETKNTILQRLREDYSTTLEAYMFREEIHPAAAGASPQN
ncbi:hypothetical protein GF373_11225 [bacterium]|nr:hypothetical protein [bacterium]